MSIVARGTISGDSRVLRLRSWRVDQMPVQSAGDSHQVSRGQRLLVIAKAIRTFAIFSLVMLAAGGAIAEERPDAERRGREALARKLTEFKGADRGQVIPIQDESLARSFPQDLFYVLRFRQYPVALAVPEPLKANNLLLVKPDDSVDHITGVEGLEIFFRTTLAPVKTEVQATDAVKAWLRLAQEFYHDGFFQFSIPDEAIRVVSTTKGGLEVIGKAVVKERGLDKGDIVASLVFDQSGSLAKASETVSLKRGIRPICQATKLLDADPIVRAMAEQAILVMGKAAKEYLDEQRIKASPKLQHAIDRIWQRILTEDR